MEQRELTPEQYAAVVEVLGDIVPELTWLKLLSQMEPLGQVEPGVSSCFISFSHKDGEFATYLFSRLRDAGIEVWYSIENIKGGKKIHKQIESAIREYNKTLIILSENSLQSEWVMTEIRYARKIEIKEKKRKLFPIRLIEYNTIRAWECFDADTGKDLAVEVREYYIPDFSNWKDHNTFEAEFDRLLRDLKPEKTMQR